MFSYLLYSNEILIFINIHIYWIGFENIKRNIWFAGDEWQK